MRKPLKRTKLMCKWHRYLTTKSCNWIPLIRYPPADYVTKSHAITIKNFVIIHTINKVNLQ